MSSTLVLQSYKKPLSNPWLATCVQTVENWAFVNNFEYLSMGDEIFDYLPTALLDKIKHQKVIATDLARLKALQDFLSNRFSTVIWCDVDFLIFKPNNFSLLDESYAVGREVWIQNANKYTSKLIVHKKVHNAFMYFRRGNVFLDFYSETAQRLLTKNRGKMSPQFIGPKLLTAIHNVAQCPVQETAGMLSPLVIKDIVRKGGKALDLFIQNSPNSLFAANLCNSLYIDGQYSANEINNCIDLLLSENLV